ncbi:Crp/Fnr family transcriptional regulator [Neptunomonas sp.]|uniref:Crp/Fnr family transcriptional regulator n=1 Tax=Neptunomonas sp. TaxID=1971898 RepID=UPI0025D4B299|nr:Crp/Fnr family transcriptional regulator [Neptunomonas sp.]
MTSKPAFEQSWAIASKHVLFSAHEADISTQLSEHSRVISLKNDEYLFMQGDAAHNFYLVLEGKIKLFRLSIDGNEKIIEVVQPQQTFAEAVMFMEGSSYPVSAQAIGCTQVLSINNQAYMDSIAMNPDCCKRLLAKMAEKLHVWLNEIETLTIQNARHRLIRFLLAHIPDLSVQSATIKLPMAKRLIASRLAMQPETFSRIMHELKDKEIITVKGLTVHVLDVQCLKNHN